MYSGCLPLRWAKGRTRPPVMLPGGNVEHSGYWLNRLSSRARNTEPFFTAPTGYDDRTDVRIVSISCARSRVGVAVFTLE